MGIGSSKGDAAAAAAAARQERKRREEEIQRRGVLIPPSFGVASLSPTTTGAPSAVVLSSGLSSLRCRLPWLRPSLLHDLSVHDVSHRILNDYMQTGFWLSSSVSQDSRCDTNVKAAFQFQDKNPSPSGSSNLASGNPTGLITLHRSSLSSVNATSVSAPLPTSTRVCFGTADAPSATASWHVVTAPLQLALLGHAAVDGIGWVGGHADVPLHLPRNNDNNHDARVRLGGWLAGSAKKKPIGAGARFAGPSSSSSWSSSWRSLPDEVSGYAAIDMLGSTAAMEVQLPLQSLQYESRSYFSINLTDAPKSTDATSSSGAATPAVTPPPPPLVVTLERTHSSRESTSSLALSQVLHVDRYQINPLEDRAPRIRNALAWTIRLDRVGPPTITHPNAAYLSHDEAMEASPGVAGAGGGGARTTCSVGGAWQINRAVALKAVAHSDRTVTAALLLRRWKEPRITCNVLFRHDLNDARPRPQFLGLGVQVELGNDLRHEYADEPASYYAATNDSVPETKASLPTSKP